MNTQIKFWLHAFCNVAVQSAILKFVHTEPWLNTLQLLFLLIGLYAAFVDTGVLPRAD